jgi:stage II sporulation protein R
VLREYGRSLSVFDSASEAKRALTELTEEIEDFCNLKLDELSDEGYKARVTLTEEWYETRDYGEFSLPKGYYTSLRIIIGRGEGENWWCVMFPPLCLDAATEDIGYSAEEELLISKKYTVKFKIVEVISEFWK